MRSSWLSLLIFSCVGIFLRHENKIGIFSVKRKPSCSYVLVSQVVLPSGHAFLSGALNLTSKLLFRVDGVLLGSTNPDKYPIVPALPGYGSCRDSGFPAANGYGKCDLFPLSLHFFVCVLADFVCVSFCSTIAPS